MYTVEYYEYDWNNNLIAQGVYNSESKQDVCILVMPDHFTPVSLKKHTSEPVPYMLWCSKRTLGNADEYCERTAIATGDFLDNPRKLTDFFFSLQ